MIHVRLGIGYQDPLSDPVGGVFPSLKARGQNFSPIFIYQLMYFSIDSNKKVVVLLFLTKTHEKKTVFFYIK